MLFENKKFLIFPEKFARGGSIGDWGEDLTLVKLTKDHGNVGFVRIQDPRAATNGVFAVTRASAPSVPLDPGHVILADTDYLFCFGILDNGNFDWNDRLGTIVDPMAIAAKRQSSDNGGSGGGCNTGVGAFGILMLFATVTVARRRRRK